MKTTSRIVQVSAVLLVAAGLLGGCVYQPAPGYGYYGPPPATVVVGGGWGWGWGHGGGWGWRR